MTQGFEDRWSIGCSCPCAQWAPPEGLLRTEKGMVQVLAQPPKAAFPAGPALHPKDVAARTSRHRCGLSSTLTIQDSPAEPSSEMARS